VIPETERRTVYVFAPERLRDAFNLVQCNASRSLVSASLLWHRSQINRRRKAVQSAGDRSFILRKHENVHNRHCGFGNKPACSASNQ